MSLLRLHIVTDTDNNPLLTLYFTLISLRGVEEFPLWKAALDRVHHPAHLIQPTEVVPRSLFKPVRERLDMIRPSKRIDGVRDFGLVSDNLLSAKLELDRLFFGKGERFVHRVGMERLRASQHRRQSLQRGAHDVVHGLLRGP